MSHYLLASLLTLWMATVTSGPKPVQEPEESGTSVVYVRILELHGDTMAVADMTPTPQVVLAIHSLGPAIEHDKMMKCHYLQDILVCDGGIFEFVGCYPPEPTDNPAPVIAERR